MNHYLRLAMTVTAMGCAMYVVVAGTDPALRWAFGVMLFFVAVNFVEDVAAVYASHQSSEDK